MPVYIASLGKRGPAKIGWTKADARKRVSNLQTGHHENLVLMAVIEGPPELEGEIHQRFWHLRIRGEWFRFDRELRTFCMENRPSQPLSQRKTALQQWIKAERLAGRHWTQEKVAERVGVHKVTLNKMLSGRLEARAGIMQRVAELTGGAVGLMDWPAREDAA